MKKGERGSVAVCLRHPIPPCTERRPPPCRLTTTTTTTHHHREGQADGSLDLTGREGGLLGVASKTASLIGKAVEVVADALPPPTNGGDPHKGPQVAILPTTAIVPFRDVGPSSRDRATGSLWLSRPVKERVPHPFWLYCRYRKWV